MIRPLLLTMALLAPATSFGAPSTSSQPMLPWISDCGDGTYRNPIIHADYSDPDAIRVGQDYWMVSSSFSHVPGLPILHSTDLVNWELVAHALPRLIPADVFATPQHGKGVWAPSIRHHAGKFWIYYPDPDFGLYVITADNPRGPWSDPTLVKSGQGLIDPCPLWDDDGTLYLIHGWAKSRAGIANVLTLLRLNSDGTRVEEDFGVVVDGDKLPNYRTLEGPKLYQRNGWYYIFAPAGGVATGWQSVFRARNIRGPYEDRIVLAQGSTPINGPHQGALVDTPSGQEWFLHFQDLEAYGRIVHLQPVVWQDDWPVIGTDPDHDGRGEPVLTYQKPLVGGSARQNEIHAPASSDDFGSASLGLQWQWQANPQPDWYSLTAAPGAIRLFAQPEPAPGNLYDAAFLLLQKFPALEFTVTTKLTFSPRANGDTTGLMIFGFDYAWLGLSRRDGATSLVLATRHDAAKGEPQSLQVLDRAVTGPVWLQVSVHAGAKCRFAWSSDGTTFTTVDAPDFTATVGRWVGAKVGLFASGAPGAFVDSDWFHVEPLKP